jgi:hypothetical protein
MSATALAACKTDWAKARSRFDDARLISDEFTVNIVNATTAFLRGRQAHEAFRGGWTAEELFGVTLQKPFRVGLVCAVVNATLVIVKFDGPWAWVDAASNEEHGDGLYHHIRSDFQFRDSIPWWRHPTYTG